MQRDGRPERCCNSQTLRSWAADIERLTSEASGMRTNCKQEIHKTGCAQTKCAQEKRGCVQGAHKYV